MQQPANSPDSPEARILDALYAGATDGTAFAHALALLADRFSCQAGALLAVDSLAPATDMIVTNGVLSSAARLYVEQFAEIDPAPATFARLPIGRASTTDRILPRQQREDGAFLQEFFRPLGLVETLGGHLFSGGSRFSLIGLQRGTDRREFSDAEIADLERLMPHISRALQIRRALIRLEARNAGLETALDRLEAGVLLLDGGGEVLFANRALQRLARAHDGLSVDRAGRPLPTNLEARRRFEALVRQLALGGAGGIVAVPRPSGARPYVMLVAPLPAALGQGVGARNRAGALLLVHDPASRPPEMPEILQKSLGLPPGAARLVAALAADDNLKSFAEREGITIHTVRYHLRTALARTDTRTQSDLVRLAVGLLRDFGLGREDQA